MGAYMGYMILCLRFRGVGLLGDWDLGFMD